MARRSCEDRHWLRAGSQIPLPCSTQRRLMTTARSRFMSACQCTTSRWCRPSISSTTTSPSGKSHSASRYRHRPAASFRRLCRVGGARPNFLQRCAEINLPKRLGTCGNVGNRQPQICLMANATDRAHRRIQPCSRSDPLLDSCCDHQTREAWTGLPCRGVKNRARRVGTRKSMGTHNVLQSQSSRFMYANAGDWCHAGAALDN